MTALPTPEVLISEVGLRDGLQSVKATMATADKLAWLDALVAAGLQELEVGSFVPARLLPQLADTAEVLANTAHDQRDPALPWLLAAAREAGRNG